MRKVRRKSMVVMALYLVVILIVYIFTGMLMMDDAYASANDLVVIGAQIGLSVSPSDTLFTGQIIF